MKSDDGAAILEQYNVIEQRGETADSFDASLKDICA